MEIQGYAGFGLQPFVFPRAAQMSNAGKGDNHLAVRVKHGEDAGAAFAQDVARRIEDSLAKADQGDPKNNPRTPPKDSGELIASLTRAVEFIRKEFGDRAATTTMGLVYKGLSKEEVTEEQLSQGLLSALGLIDRQFGFAAGDKVIDFFNSDLNQAINDFFDNGRNETFFAATPGTHSQTLAAPELAQESSKEAAASILELLRQGLLPEEETVAPLPDHLHPSGTTLPTAYAAPITDPALPGTRLDMVI